ncbi:MAG: hypothetical protein N3A66_12205, partial [Planctomycetota bacterium]|nr:hypothetical protein [Planctomycetota bacterium]
MLKTVLRPSKAYSIDDVVKVDGYYYRFRVRASHGEYEAISVRHLIKLCREIEVIEAFKASDKENHIWTGAAQAAKGIGVGFANIIIHPGQTAKNIGRSTGRLFRALGAPFRSRGESKASDGTDRAWLGKGPAGGERRLVAYELGIDVYTDNPAAQALIKEVAKRRFAGKLPLNLGVFALPGGAIFTMALTPMGHDISTEILIRDNSPDELKRVLGLYYLNQFGIDWRKKDSPAQLLLDNPNYSPREQAYLGRYLNDLHDLEGVEEAMRFLAKVDSPAKAAIVSAQVELLALLHARAKPLRRFVPIRNTLGAESRD